MDLLLVISSLGGGGAERVMSRLADGWVASGARVTLATFESTTCDFFRVAGPIVRRSWADEQSCYPSRLPGAVRRTRWVRGLIQQSQPDAVISFTDRTNVVALLAARGLKVPVIVSERTDPTMSSPGQLWALGRKISYPGASAIVVQTGRVLEWAQSQFPRTHAVVIPNPVPPLEVIESSPPSSVIVAAGRLGPEKGFDLLIDAFSRIAARWPEWTLKILGEGSVRPQLEAQIIERGLSGRVLLPGQSRDAVRQIAAAEIFVLSSRFEGFPNVLVEAMATGRAAIAFDCRSGPSDLIQPEVNGLLVPAGDVTGMAQALDRMMGDPQLRLALGTRARQVSDQLSLATILEEWNSLLRWVGCEPATPAQPELRRRSA